MNLKVQVKAIDLVTKLANGHLNQTAYINYEPQKKDYVYKKQRKPFPRSTPEKQGISSEYLQTFLEELGAEESIHTQGIMIVRNGSVILEGAYKPYDLNMWRATHSLSKSLVGIATGIAIEEGYFQLEDTVASIFNKTYLPILSGRKKDITIYNLLTMSSGIGFNEVGVLIDENWIEDFLNSQTHFEPGKDFQYNSMNTYMLSAIIQERSGQTLEEFLTERLFEPLGIDNVSWEKSPEKRTKGGWGLYITLEDRTKIGQLFLNEGMWEGKRIVSKGWLDMMTKKVKDTPPEMNLYGYGAHVWMGKRTDSFLFNGVLGQNTIVYPDMNMVISIMSSDYEMFVNSRLMDIVDKYFSSSSFEPAESLKENPHAYRKLQNYLAGMYFQKEFSWQEVKEEKKFGWSRFKMRKRNRFGEILSDLPEDIDKISFSNYHVEENDIGIMPLFVQTLQNNFSQGITWFQFKKENGGLILSLQEHDMKLDIPIGFSQPKYSVLNFREERYQVAVLGKLKMTEEDIPVLKLQISFLETTNCRNLLFYFYKDHVWIKAKEIPAPNKVIDQLTPIIGFSLPAGGVETIKNSDLVQGKVIRMTEPETKAFPLD